jgi:hypothetical protein
MHLLEEQDTLEKFLELKKYWKNKTRNQERPTFVSMGLPFVQQKESHSNGRHSITYL